MNYYQKYKQFSDAKFRRMVGVTKEQFAAILILFQAYVDKNWTKRGRPSNFSLEDRLLLTFRYLRDYPTFVVLGNEFGISESFCNKIFNKVSQALVKILKLPNLNQLENTGTIIEKVLIDACEQETERPKKKQKTKFSGKKKKHTEKALISFSPDLNQILTVDTNTGSVHDFKIFKESRIWTYQIIQQANTELDLGFIGVNKYLKNATVPHKSSKKNKLTKEQKRENKQLAKSRIKIENINREIKIFRICKETRRHKQKKHNLFWNLIAGVVNFKLRN